uniref:Uncharacterized protein n=1 Tax=Opuntia streptacantha TaxID=393608 RepID=A0A7C9F983_OPUST
MISIDNKQRKRKIVKHLALFHYNPRPKIFQIMNLAMDTLYSADITSSQSCFLETQSQLGMMIVNLGQKRVLNSVPFVKCLINYTHHHSRNFTYTKLTLTNKATPQLGLPDSLTHPPPPAAKHKN